MYMDGMTSVDKQLNCVFWFQNPLKDLVRPLYNYSRTDPVRCPDSPSLYSICHVSCVSVNSILTLPNLAFRKYCCKLYCWEFIFAWIIWEEFYCIYVAQLSFIYFLLECFGENVGVFILQKCLFCWLTMIKLVFSLINKFYYVLSHNLM